jgi:mRNA interferase YafQ
VSKYFVRYTNLYKKQRKLLIKRGYDISLLDNVVKKLMNGEILDEKYADHALQGERVGQRDCHIKPDWILIYEKQDDILTLVLCETGTHSDLF